MTTKFTKKDYFKLKLNQTQGKETNNIPHYVIDLVKTQLKGVQPTHCNIQDILKENNLREYYQNIPSILLKLNVNLPIPKIDECCVCFNTTTLNKVFCNHSFCKECINKIIELDTNQRFTCPLCRKTFKQELIKNTVITENDRKIILEKFDEWILNENKIGCKTNINYNYLLKIFTRECNIEL